MISVQNHRQQLNGNKCFFLLFIVLCLAACSPKLQSDKNKKTVSENVEKAEKEANENFKEADISLLIPFKLNEIRLKSASKAEVEKAAMAIDFYQGFKLGIDSAASMGLNFKLHVYDTRDSNTQLDGLFKNNGLLGSNLIVGPIFPENLKHTTNYSIVHHLPVVSPLAASRPNEFNNPNLISIVNNIDLHAIKIGDYISKNYNKENTIVVLINPKKGDDEVFGGPLRDYFQKSQNNKFIFQEYASVYTMETKLIKNKKYVILLSSSNKPFVSATIDKLLKIKKTGISIDLFGHPNWIKQDYNIDKLQALNACITSSYKVDYRRTAVIDFIKKYREAFDFEPSEYSFKGFDIGFYFGRLLSEHGTSYLKYLTKEKYKGLHNSFAFVYDAKFGYTNTSLMLLNYKNYALNIVE